MVESPFFLKNIGGKDLFAIFFDPGTPNKSGVLICQPIAEERHRAKRVLINLSRFLCHSGYPVLFVDYWGEGDSDGSFEDATVTSRLSDIKSGLLFMKDVKTIERFHLIGLSFGASLAERFYCEEIGITSKILVNPVVSGKDYLLEWMKINLASQLTRFGEVKYPRQILLEKIVSDGFIEIEGFIFSKNFYEELNSFNLISLIDQDQAIRSVLELSVREQISLPTRNFVDALGLKGKNCIVKQLPQLFTWKSLKMYNPNPVDFFDTIKSLLKNHA